MPALKVYFFVGSEAATQRYNSGCLFTDFTGARDLERSHRYCGAPKDREIDFQWKYYNRKL